MQAGDLDSIFNLPLSMQAYDELLEMDALISEVPYDGKSADTWTFIWGNAVYSSRKYYQMVYNNLDAPRIFKKLWSSKCTPRLNSSHGYCLWTD